MKIDNLPSEELLQSLISDSLPRIEQTRLILFRLALKSPFETSFGSIDHREIIACLIKAEGLDGWGECAADEDPLYSYEANFTVMPVLKNYLLPALKTETTIAGFQKVAAVIRGHHMAKATVEAALWDLLAKSRGVPLYKLWGGTKNRIPCGVSVGLQKDNAALLANIKSYLKDGYRRIKIKIKPGRDYSLLEAIRNELPEIPLMADANAAYRNTDLDLLRSLDRFNLMMIEQPLHFEDLFEHSLLQAQIQTPVCLDESIVSVNIAEAAIKLKSCRIINIKTGRVGGHSDSIRIHDLASRSSIPVWCGGMLESGIGRAHNLALASLPNFTLPGDTSASNRYWHRDIIDPPVIMDPDGFVSLPEKPGMGYDVDHSFLESIARDQFIFRV